MMRRKLLLVLLVVLMACFAGAQEIEGAKAEAVKNELLKIEEAKVAGLLKGGSVHADWVEHYDSDGIVQVNADGSTLTKDQHMAGLRTQKLKIVTMRQYQHQVHVYNEGNTAVVTNRATGTGLKDGKVIQIESRFTDVWVKQDGQWLRVVHDISDVKN
ncbi:MAG: nuclear transport factor 2 family protein [Candidatus Acidiferrales bacterium]